MTSTVSFFLLWLFTIGLSLFLYNLAGPKISGVDSKTDSYRKGILWSGFIPCFGINAVYSLVFFFVYESKRKRAVAVADRMAARSRRPTFDVDDEVRPQRTQPSRSASDDDNPFM